MNLRSELYFTTRATEEEHEIIEHLIREFCKENPDVQLLYYRRFKTGDIPTYREIKLVGFIPKFIVFAAANNIKIGNYWRENANN